MKQNIYLRKFHQLVSNQNFVLYNGKYWCTRAAYIICKSMPSFITSTKIQIIDKLAHKLDDSELQCFVNHLHN